MEKRFCQCCAMPMDNTELYGTEADGSRSNDYCKYCYEKGEFTFHGSMSEMIDYCVPHMVEANPALTAEKAREMMKEFFPKLKRWKACEQEMRVSSAQKDIYSDILIKRVASFNMASYVIISQNPEDDVNRYMEMWAESSGLKSAYPDVKHIGWDFPFVSQEQQTRFGLRGYVSAYVLPTGFETNYPGVQYSENAEADYAVITITEPFIQQFERIPNAYKLIFSHLQANNFQEKQQDSIISCFEYVYQNGGVTYMDVYVHADGATKIDAFTKFN